ncbi:pyruvate dehydrogenase complex E1 component subunit beta [Mycolicibacterium goodii]|uniref:3-methyl-2-oxobutanoate dehydrogenase subunit beta n=1 Tax=Mycolicibacterium goodii TaxID=134601 RepID=A0A0K0XA81_MYCGD|nr:2-oxoisovalerate dehydrogenase [Mycolicibacterium goodii]
MTVATEPDHSLVADRPNRLDLYLALLRIRAFENAASKLYRESEIPGFVHLSVGQEAVAVGACWGLRDDDIITSNHRGHGHVLAKGADMKAMFAELMAKDTGTCRGRGGSMHIADLTRGVYGANGIVGAGLPIAVGAATAIKLRRTDNVVFAFFGDGAAAQGAFHESINLAVTLALPVVFLCENNHFAEFSTSETFPTVSLEQRAKGYGVPYLYADGNDVDSVLAVAEQATARVRAGGGPVLMEAETYRVHGHYEGDPQRYRSASEFETWQKRDPILLLRERLISSGVSPDEIAAVERAAEAEVDQAVGFARTSPVPSEDSLRNYVYGDPVAVRITSRPDEPAGEPIRMSRAIAKALSHELEDSPETFLAGIDVGAGGNVFGITRGLYERFPGRVIDTPISETALMGMGIGAAMSGMKPVVELMYLDFMGVCFDQLLNQAAKMRFMTGGQGSVPMTVRTQFGAGRSSGSQHSQSLEALFAHVPGLKVVMPSTPADAYGLLRAAIADADPVIFIENRLLYETKGAAPPRGHLLPIGKAEVVRPGTDITLVSMSRMVHRCLAVAAELAADGVACEVIDLRTISPLDHTTVLESVAKTSRLLVVHEAVSDFGVGAELAARIADEGFTLMDAPIRRIGALPMPAPYAPNLEALWLPDDARITAAVRELVAY